MYEVLALQSLVAIAEQNLHVGRAVIRIEWLNDDLTGREDTQLLLIRSAVESDPGIQELFQSIYASGNESAGDHLLRLAPINRELATAVVDHSDQWGEGLMERIAWSLNQLSDTGQLGLFTTQPWFTDGLSAEEIVFMAMFHNSETDVPLASIPGQRGFAQRHTVSLPLSGQVRIWAFYDTPRTDMAIVGMVEDSLSEIERLLQAPLPLNDIVMLAATRSSFGSAAGSHSTSRFTVNLSSDYRKAIPHEVGHYYFSDGPLWFVEGAAEVMRAYVHDRWGVETVAARSSAVASSLAQRCMSITNAPIENIWHYRYVEEHWPSAFPIPLTCVYPLGENFLLTVRSLIGDEALSSALSELYLSKTEGEAFSEESIYELLLKHTPSEKRASFTEIYDRLHGGPFSNPTREIADDHSDLWTAATPITLNEEVHGTFDYRADLDLFKFRAEEGRRYRVVLQHESVGASGISLFSSDGSTLRSLDSNTASDFVLTSSGPQALLLTRTSGDHYLSIQNFNGAPGAYRIQVSAADVPGDSGNTPSTANEISVGTAVQGAIDDVVDADYFRFSAAEGQRYRIEVAYHSTMPFRIFRLDEGNNRTNFSVIYGSGSWTPSRAGTYYIQLSPADVRGRAQPYTLSITPE